MYQKSPVRGWTKGLARSECAEGSGSGQLFVELEPEMTIGLKAGLIEDLALLDTEQLDLRGTIERESLDALFLAKLGSFE